MSHSKNKVYYVQLNYLLMPRASSLLRKLFRSKWLDTFKSEWMDTEEQGELFTETIGKEIYITASRRQKQLLRTGRIDLWDLQLLCNILLKLELGSLFVNKNLIEIIAHFHAQVRRIPNHSLTRDEFNSIWENVKEILIQLGESSLDLQTMETTSDLDDIRVDYTSSPPIDDQVTAKAEEFHCLGNDFHKRGHLNDAIECYNKSIALYGPSRNLAVVYSHRSAANLVLNDEIDILSNDKNQKLARDDAKSAVELWPTWFESHYRLGKAYEALGNGRKAVKHYDIALVLNPSKTKIQQFLNGLKECAYSPDDDEFEIECSAEYLDSKKTTFNILGESYSTVWNGLCHLSGHEVEKNETMAANLLSQAASYGNTYAMLVLANMYIKGLGVEKDPDKYIELLVKVTEQPLVENGRRNKDVATAEHNLGVSYSKGIGVRKDLERAIEWYNLAADHGFAMAAYILGCHYMRGSGVERNEEKAVECWKEAARGKLANAMRSLSHYFYNDLEPDQALKWHKRALLCEQDDKTYEVFEDNLTILKQLCRFNQIMKWEETIRLSIDGLSVRERKYRFIRDKIPISNFFDKNESLLTEKDIPVAVKKVFDGYNYAFESVFRLNEFDTGLGWRLQQAVIRFGRALLSLKAINKAGEKFKFIYELARCLKTELIVAQWDPPDRKLAAEVVRELWIDMRNYTWLNELDKEARICYVYFYRNQVVLRDCVAKYPEEVYFRRLLVTSLSDHEEGLREVEKALEVFHNDCELLFGKAKHLSGLGKNFLVVKALEDFISFAPPKHWLIPEAYYAMALRYVRLNPEINCESVQNAKLKVMDYFCSGMSAETIKLPWLIKYRNGRLEKLFELTIEMKLGRKKAVDCRSKLVEPSRVELIKLHRKRVRENVAEDEADKEDAVVCFEKEKILFLLLTLKFIDLSEMNRTGDHVYRGVSVSVTVIEDFFVFNGVHFLVEDRNLDVRRVRLVNGGRDEGKRFAYGSKIIIREPIVRMEMDARQSIWIENVESVIFVTGEDLKVCRFCRRSIDKGMCSKCMKAYYCSKQCQINDWKVMKHKLICF